MGFVIISTGVLMQKDLISVILPCYNVERWLDDCFKSIKAQTYQNIEVIFVDDGSKDNTLKMIEDFCKSDERFKFVSKPNGGVSSARNSGLAAANGEFVYFCDPDDVLHPQILEILHKTCKDADLSVCSFKQIGEEKKFDQCKLKSYSSAKIKTTNCDIMRKFVSQKWKWCPWNKLYKMENIKKIQNFPNVFETEISVGEDFEFNLKYFQTIEKLNFTNQRLYFYRQRNGSAMRSNFSEKMLKISNIFDDALLSKNKKYEACKYDIRAVYAMFSQDCLFRALRAKNYHNSETIKWIYRAFRKNRKFVYRTKYIPFWLKLALPFSSLYFMFAANIKICRCKQYEKKAQKIKK